MKINKIIIFLTFTLVFNNLFAQTITKDKNFEIIFENILTSKFDISTKLIKEQRKRNYPNNEFMCDYLSVINYCEMRKLDSAEIIITKINKYEQKPLNPKFLNGLIEFRNSNFSIAFTNLLQTETAVFHTNSERLNSLFKVYFKIYLGRTYAQTGIYSLAIEKFIEAYNISNKINFQNLSATINKFLGRAYMNIVNPNTEMFSKAKSEFNNAYQIFEKTNNIEEIKWMYIIFSDFYIQKQEFDSADFQLELCMKELNTNKDKELQGLYLNNKGEIFLHKKQYSLAESFFKKSIEKYKEVNNFTNRIVTYQNLSEIKFNQNDYLNSSKYADTAYQLSLQTSSKYKTVESLTAKAKALFKMNNINSYLYLIEAKKINEEISNQQNFIIAFSYKEKFDNERLVNKNKALIYQNNMKSQKLTNTIFISLSVVLIISLILTVLIIKWRNNKLKMKKELIELQFNSLLNQMYPHFLFNAITNISGAIYTQKADEAYNYTTKLTKLIRSYHQNIHKLTRSIEEELDFTRTYLDIQKYRFKERFKYSIITEKNVDLQIKIPQMLIHTFVENAVKHGLEPMEENGELIIKILKNNRKNIIIVEDNGIGLEEAKKRKSTGTGSGLKIISELVSLFNRTYNKNIKYQIIDLYKIKKSGTKIEISL
jgi:tetratricopeptide (TPR) repeat protein